MQCSAFSLIVFEMQPVLNLCDPAVFPALDIGGPSGRKRLRTKTSATPPGQAPGDVYFEHQYAGLCAVHATNNVVGQCIFGADAFERSVSHILNEAAMFAAMVGQELEERQENHSASGGWYSEQVIAGALLAGGRWLFDQTHNCQLGLKHYGITTWWVRSSTARVTGYSNHSLPRSPTASVQSLSQEG